MQVERLCHIDNYMEREKEYSIRRFETPTGRTLMQMAEGCCCVRAKEDAEAVERCCVCLEDLGQEDLPFRWTTLSTPLSAL